MRVARPVVSAVIFLLALGAESALAERPFAAASLPATSTAEVDAMLAQLETAYRSMDADRFVAFFTEDFEQVSVNRRVHVQGREQWRDWTIVINDLHESMERRHLGRVAQGDFVIVETEWSGRLKPHAAGWNEAPLDYRYRGLIVTKLRDGKIARQTIYDDYNSFLEQFNPPEADADASGNQ